MPRRRPPGPNAPRAPCHPSYVPTVAPTSKRRNTSATVATKPGCRPLKEMYEWAESVRAMEAFDANVASGVADIGDLQNGKGDFFNDLLSLILENCASVELFSRSGVPGFIFANHNLDVTFPNTGVVKFTLEAKAVGTPKHQLSPKQRAIGRPGSADLGKRVKEVAFKTIDLKAEHGRLMAMAGQSPEVQPGGNLTTWLRSVRPSAYLFIAARIVSKTDLAAVIAFAQTAAQVEDAVGVFCFCRPARGWRLTVTVATEGAGSSWIPDSREKLSTSRRSSSVNSTVTLTELMTTASRALGISRTHGANRERRTVDLPAPFGPASATTGASGNSIVESANPPIFATATPLILTFASRPHRPQLPSEVGVPKRGRCSLAP